VSDKIYFEFINNLIIIPLEVNNVTLSFILDTGVSRPILFNLTERDSLDLKDTQTFYLHGLGGDGQLKTLKSSYNRFKIGNAVSTNQDLYVVYDETINFTSRLGVLVHGILAMIYLKILWLRLIIIQNILGYINQIVFASNSQKNGRYYRLISIGENLI
jgi:hypothetical protein